MFGRICTLKIIDSTKNSFSFYTFEKFKPFKVDIFTKTVSENVVHDKCDKECFIQMLMLFQNANLGRRWIPGLINGPSCLKLVSENETQKSVFEIDYECQVNKNVVEPGLECIRDCADVKYVCNCNVYRYRTNIRFKPCSLIHVHIPDS